MTKYGFSSLHLYWHLNLFVLFQNTFPGIKAEKSN